MLLKSSANEIQFYYKSCTNRYDSALIFDID